MLNKEQEEAVYHMDGPCIVTACPGSGKTRVIVHRASNLLNNNVDARNILMLTFTNKAAKEMKQRLISLCKNNQASELIMCCTFHSLCVRILKKYNDACGLPVNFNIMSEDDCLVIANSIFENNKIKFDAAEAKKFIHIINSKRENDDIDIDKADEWFSDSTYNIMAKEYLSAIKQTGNIDFTGLLHEVYILLKNNDHIRNILNNKFKYVMVDEVQDTNLLQFEILKYLSMHKNIFMVGDLDQSIYKFRGAKPENMIKYCESNNAKLIKLTTNYRCGQRIIELANNIIVNNKNRLNNKIVGSKEDKYDVAYDLSVNREEEAYVVAKKIKNTIANGALAKEIAILFRTNHLSRSFELACARLAIPYDVVGAFKFFEREEVKDIVSMLKFLNNPNDTMSLFRFINKPKKGIGPKVFGKFVEDYSNNKRLKINEYQNIYTIVDSFIAYGNKNKVIDSIDFVINQTRYMEYVKIQHPESYQDRIDNINELKNSCISFDNRGNTDLNAWLLNIMLMDSQDGDESSNKIKLMSMHAAKGLEFDHVFVVAMEDGICPHKRAIEENYDNIDEERRLLYVAVTRAKTRLHLSSCVLPDMRSQKIANISRFLIESNFINLDHYKNEVYRIIKSYKEQQY